MGSEGPSITQVGRESVVSRDVTPGREKNVVILAHVEDSADVVTGPVAPVARIFAEIEYLGSQGEDLRYFALTQPARLNMTTMVKSNTI